MKNQKILKYSATLYCLLFIIFTIPLGFADDFEPAELTEDGTTSTEFILDSGNNVSGTGNIKLQFGANLDKYILYNLDLEEFQINADLNLNNYELKSFRIENLSSAPNCATATKGRQYFNTSDNKLYICNGSNWTEVGSSGSVTEEPLAAIQARRTSAFTINTSYADVSLDTTDLENDNTVINHDNSSTDRIQVLANGIYQITYNVNIDIQTSTSLAVDARIRINDTTVLNGSQSRDSSIQTGSIDNYAQISQIMVASLNTNDYLTLQLRVSSGTLNTRDDVTMTVIKLDGVVGPEGPGGGGGTLDQSYDEGGAGAGRVIYADNGAVRIDATSSTNAPLELTPYKGIPSTGISGGQLFYNNEGLLFAYDPTRSKWLSVQRMAMGYGRNSSNTSNTYLRQYNGADSSNNGWRMIRDGTITAIAAQSNANDTWVFEIRKNDTKKPIATLTMKNTPGNQLNNLNIDFSVGDYLQGYCNGSNVDYPQSWFEFAWRP